MASGTVTSDKRVIIVGGGLAGLAAAVRVTESGLPVDLFSLVPVKRSHSVCAQGGINACNDVARQQGYSEYEHFDETIYGGDFLADQPPVYEMTAQAPRIIDLLDRMGVPFNRTSEGFRDLRLFGGSLHKRTHFSGATTGQQLMYAMDEQTRRLESEGRVVKYEHWEFLAPIVEGGRCVGIVAQDLRSMQVRAFRASAVVIATGGCGLVFGKSTNSVMCTGAAAARCYQHGVQYANGEFVQVHPTAIPGADKCRLMSESARGEGGRVWVPRAQNDNRPPLTIPKEERWYFLEEKYPKYGNLVPRDIATREIFNVCMQGHGVDGQNQVYLDLTHKDPEYLKRKLEGILEIYEKFVGEDPYRTPMKIFPAVHYSMGGLLTTYAAKPEGRGLVHGDPANMMTNIRGLYAFGEVNFAYHGANRLGANALLSCLFDGFYNGLSVANFALDAAPPAAISQGVLDRATEVQVQKVKTLIDTATNLAQPATTETNPYQIGREMGEEMTAASTVVKSGPRLEQALSTISALRERFTRVRLGDAATWTNQTLACARAVGDMLILAESIVATGLLRRESRGSHFREDFPARNDAEFMCTSVSSYAPGNTETPAGTTRIGQHLISYKPVDAPLVKPRLRNYGAVAGTAASRSPATAAAS
ncbi:MAG: succinate dehydrogenase (quinone) flavoprotein subunit [Phycisphaerales bacterium]